MFPLYHDVRSYEWTEACGYLCLCSPMLDSLQSRKEVSTTSTSADNSKMIIQCRACKWKGTDTQCSKVRIPKGKVSFFCPECGSDDLVNERKEPINSA
jgi:RNase P subunit RPR2